jgi:hypothetical protein
MNDLHSLRDLQAWAEQCERASHDPRSTGAEREYLLEMARGLDQIQREREWLDGEAIATLVEGYFHPCPALP